MLCIEKLDWLPPLSVAAGVPEAEKNWLLLYSGMQTAYSGRFSYLALQQIEQVGQLAQAEEKLTFHHEKLDNSWFGYLGYGLKNQLEKLPHDKNSFINSPDMYLARFGIILQFDHEHLQISVWLESNDYMLFWQNLRSKIMAELTINKAPPPKVAEFSSNMTTAEYLQKVDTIKQAIIRGDLYQANLTRKFYGTIESPFSHFDIFANLCHLSPATYSAFIKCNDLYIISSSPERFLQVDAGGNANMRPIKGSAARNPDAKLDKIAIETLQNSEKDRAENLMIVDLCRNDLSRNCDVGSVQVKELFAIESYANLHHMVSSINGKRSKKSSTLDLIKGCFPPGSMTGTPKIKAIELCSQLEQLKRGIYSGTIGWFGGDGSADLSVVIRTIIMENNKFEFQVGGAIVSDSTPEAELAETMIKAKAMMAALGIRD